MPGAAFPGRQKHENVSYLSGIFGRYTKITEPEQNSITVPMKYSEIKSHLSKFRIGIAGAGGLGSNCAVALARCGVGTLVIADYDLVEPSNLNRQYYFADQVGLMKTRALKENIFRINPDIIVIDYAEKVNPGNIASIFSGCDIIVEAFDSASMKEMLVETLQTSMPVVPVIVGSGMAGWGKSNDLKCRKIDRSLYVCGDEYSDAAENLPLLAPRVGIVASMQANLVLELLMDINS